MLTRLANGLNWFGHAPALTRRTNDSVSAAAVDSEANFSCIVKATVYSTGSYR